ncbi:MAG: hypothetical protein AB7U61_04625 [Methylocystis sp.]
MSARRRIPLWRIILATELIKAARLCLWLARVTDRYQDAFFGLASRIIGGAERCARMPWR